MTRALEKMSRISLAIKTVEIREFFQIHYSSYSYGLMDSFYIDLVDNDQSSIDSNEYFVKEGFIQYS